MESGDLVLMDVGGEYAGYATDVTRTVPAGGKFTPRQREIYDIVLAAQKAAIAAVRPGMTLLGDSSTSLRKIAMDYINTHGKDLHGAPLGKYFVHGLGHFVGLEVHDPGSSDTRLEPGMVITIEPGVYLPEENLGIRIEDRLWSRPAEVLSSALPKAEDRKACWRVGAISFTLQYCGCFAAGTLAGWTALARAWITTRHNDPDDAGEERGPSSVVVDRRRNAAARGNMHVSSRPHPKPWSRLTPRSPAPWPWTLPQRQRR
jgi:hypothetical protein